jgi:hypothetical protein
LVTPIRQLVPSPGAVVTPLDVSFVWIGHPRAKRYRFFLRRGLQSGAVKLQRVVYRCETTLPCLSVGHAPGLAAELVPGDYEWMIEALDATGALVGHTVDGPLATFRVQRGPPAGH